MHRFGSKTDKQQTKNARLLSSLKSSSLLLLSTIGLLYTLLAVSVSSELLQQVVAYQDAAIIYIALGTLIVLGFSRAMRWSWPVYVEEPLILIFAWALLSILLGSYTICGDGIAISSSSSALEDTTIEHTNESLAMAEYIHGMDDTQQHAMETPDNDDDEHSPTDLSQWMTRQADHYSVMAASCNAYAFNIVYSVVVLLTLLCSALCDVRNYWAALLFRVVTVVLFLGVILIPTTCNRYKLLDPNVVILKVVICFMLWLYCHYKRNTEELLERHYGQSLQSLSENLATLQSNNQLSSSRRNRALVEQLNNNSHIPTQLFDVLERVCLFMEKSRHTDRVTSSPIRHSSHAKDDDDDDSSEDDSEGDDDDDGNTTDTPDKARMRRLKTQREEVRRLCRVNDVYYTDTWFVKLLSWKNRGFSRHASAIQDLVNTAWVLFVCPPFLLFVFLELMWLLWRIRVDEYELMACEQMHTILHEYTDKVPRDLAIISVYDGR
jgi:hypothetical protein